MIDWTSILPLLVQVPLVAVFVVFVLVRDARLEVAQAKRDSEWMSFLREQRQENNATLLKVAEEVSGMSKLATITNSLIVQHDMWERENMRRIESKLDL